MEAEEVLDGGGCVEDITFSRHHQHEAVQRLKQRKALFGASSWLMILIFNIYKDTTSHLLHCWTHELVELYSHRQNTQHMFYI